MNNQDFKRIYQNGKSKANKYLVMYVNQNHLLTENRLGISVSKKVGNSVIRHRVTRLIRESYRLNRHLIKTSGKDFVVIARSDAKGRTYKEIESAFLHLLKLHGFFENEKNTD